MRYNRQTLNRLSSLILQCAFKVHKQLGPGLLEGAYRQSLLQELKKVGLNVRQDVELPFTYRGYETDLRYRLDLIVADRIVLLTKCVDKLSDQHSAELRTHLLVSECEMGFILNFNSISLKHGVRRLLQRDATGINLAVS